MALVRPNEALLTKPTYRPSAQRIDQALRQRTGRLYGSGVQCGLGDGLIRLDVYVIESS